MNFHMNVSGALQVSHAETLIDDLPRASSSEIYFV